LFFLSVFSVGYFQPFPYPEKMHILDSRRFALGCQKGRQAEFACFASEWLLASNAPLRFLSYLFIELF